MKNASSPLRIRTNSLRKMDSRSRGARSFEQTLIRFRSELKAGKGHLLDIQEIKPRPSINPTLQAEAFFLRGSILMRQSKFAEAAKNMVAAAKLFSNAESLEKSFISDYNALVARKHLGKMSPVTVLKDLWKLSRKAEDAGFKSVVALCARQSSYLYFEEGDYEAAFEKIEVALRNFSFVGLETDYSLSLVHAADCAFELGKTEKARTLLDYLSDEATTMPKIQLRLAQVLAKLSGRTSN